MGIKLKYIWENSKTQCNEMWRLVSKNLAILVLEEIVTELQLLLISRKCY